MDCTIYAAKTKALISFAVTAKLICVFVFACAKSRFSHDAAHNVCDILFMDTLFDVRKHNVIIMLEKLWNLAF